MKETINSTDTTLAQNVFWTTAEVASRLRFAQRTIRRYAASGRIPSIKLGGRYRIPLSAVQALEAPAGNSRIEVRADHACRPDGDKVLVLAD